MLPVELLSRPNWIRRTSSKVPMTANGMPASSTDRSTWSTYDAAVASTVGVGLGFVLDGTGIGCYDLDHVAADGVLERSAAALIESTPHFYAEWSPSGDGVHLWVYAEAEKGWRRRIDGISVEFYTQHRYLTITGKPLR
ncbi:DNA primase [Microbacteriaceae bacterium VKM Ac-2855]|nr:DNA primase [Microbacteriaceae bacterium VKM Ac-2855]